MTEPEYPKIYLYRRVVQAKLFIDSHFREQIDLEKIAGEAFFSKFHFIRLFKNIYKKTPHQYLIYVRIENAKELLKKGIPVSETCVNIGFDSLSSFSGLFKKHTGQAPSVYLSDMQRMKTGIAARPLRYIPGCFAKANGWDKKSNFEEVPH